MGRRTLYPGARMLSVRLTSALESLRIQLTNLTGNVHDLNHSIHRELHDECEACAKAVEEQGQYLKEMFGSDKHDALISDLARCIRLRNKSR